MCCVGKAPMAEYVTDCTELTATITWRRASGTKIHYCYAVLM